MLLQKAREETAITNLVTRVVVLRRTTVGSDVVIVLVSRIICVFNRQWH
jgi:hypothetical protein